MCINLMPDRVDVSHVLAAARARPEVLLCDSFRKEGDEVETLGRLKRELRLDRYRCMTLLRSGNYQMLQVEAPPNVPPQEAKHAVRWRIKDLIDYPVEAATVDALFIPSNGAAGRAPQMFAVAAKNEVIAATVRPFNEADVALEVIDVPELAQRNLARLLEEEGRGLALLSFNESGGLLTFTCGGELYMYRRMDIPLDSFAGAGPEQRQALYERVVLELQRSLDHFDRQFHHVAIARVVVAPVPGAEDLQEALAANLDVPVATLELSQVMDFPQLPELNEPGRQAQCLQLLGAALREENA
ncbi:MAG TPA: agglutinin biogenesis protein MshI [Burkholderiales bacterium]|nr:agglutinin biogenesis protein MshI [Burkholderiales bacterium]